MPRLTDLLVVLVVAGFASSYSAAQDVDAEPIGDDAVEAYLTERNLDSLLAEQLAQRIEETSGAAQVPLAERLATVYVRLLADAKDVAERQQWQDRSRDLLSRVPQADSLELRLSLARAVYSQAEVSVERFRLRLAGDAESGEAERSLRELRSQFSEIATKAHRRVETLEKAEESSDPSDDLAQSLADARRTRSLAFYYSGWTEYYLAYLSNTEGLAADAMRDFGWLLNSRGGRAATLDRLSDKLLRYDHIARAAIGCALCASIRGNDTEAIRWLDAVQSAENAPSGAKAQLLARRISILAAAKRWADLERLIRLERKADRNGGGPHVQPLPTSDARLLAVVTLEADKSIAADLIGRLASVALGDLVARGEVSHILNLVERYGTAPLGNEGFIVHYVRGLQEYERARDAHKAASSGADDEPTSVPEARDSYVSAAALLLAALNQADAHSFGVERGKAALLLGRCHFFVSAFIDASKQFAEASRLIKDADDREEAMWLAYVSLDRAVTAGDPSAGTLRDQTAVLFLQTYPESERSARLLLRQSGADGAALLDTEEAIQVMLGVAQDSPVYEGARRHAARLLYQVFKRSRGDTAQFAAQRFLPVAEEVLGMDRQTAMTAKGKEAADAVARVVTRVRQLLDAILSLDTPDVERAVAVFRVLDAVTAYDNTDLSAHEPELQFRRAQIASAKGDPHTAAQVVERLQGMRDAAVSGGFADAGDRLMYRGLVTAYEKSRSQTGETFVAPVDSLAAIVRHGERIIRRLGGAGLASAASAASSSAVNLPPLPLGDAALGTLYSTVAQCADDLSRRDATPPEERLRLQTLTMSLDRRLLEAYPSLETSLVRLAGAAEASSDLSTAAGCWSRLAAARPIGSDSWFEARFQAIRLLAMTDAQGARAALNQLKALYPTFGPAPWNARLKDLDLSLPAPEPKPGGSP